MEEKFPLSSEVILRALIAYFDSEDVNKITEFLLVSRVQTVQTGYDNWNGGTYFYCINIEVPSSKYRLISANREECEQQILEKAQLLLKPYPNHKLDQVSLVPTLILDEDNILRSAPLRAVTSVPPYIELERINELKTLSSPDYDLTKLIALCEELNITFANSCYLAVPMLTRAILDHIPPIFGHRTFAEVASNYGGKSFKQSMKNLQNSSRNIADAHLHVPIRNRETLPNRTQVNFSNDLDVLLAEIVRVLK